MANGGLIFWSSVMKQKQDLKLCSSILRKWENNEWLLKEVCQTLNGGHIYTLVEFCENMKYTPCGIFSIAVTKEELDKYFYEDRKVKLQ